MLPVYARITAFFFHQSSCTNIGRIMLLATMFGCRGPGLYVADVHKKNKICTPANGEPVRVETVPLFYFCTSPICNCTERLEPSAGIVSVRPHLRCVVYHMHARFRTPAMFAVVCGLLLVQFATADRSHASTMQPDPSAFPIDQDPPFSPQVYASEAKQWGCCRHCTAPGMGRKPRQEIHIHDPSMFVNCCPFCPSPPVDASKKDKLSKLGPWRYYFQDHAKSQIDEYEADLRTFGTHMEAPASRKYHDARAGISYLEAFSALGRKSGPKAEQKKDKKKSPPPNPNAKAGQKKEKRKRLVVVRSRPPPQPQVGDASSPSTDPYYAMRGHDMSYKRTYVYGAPGKLGPPDEIGDPNPDVPDLPPCCTVCTRKTTTMSFSFEKGCCVMCGVTYAGAPAWRTRRERDEHEESFKQAQRMAAGAFVETRAREAVTAQRPVDSTVAAIREPAQTSRRSAQT